MDVSKAAAEFFMQQCIGMHDGHMAAIPNNPVLHGFVRAHMGDTELYRPEREQFADFLREAAERIYPAKDCDVDASHYREASTDE